MPRRVGHGGFQIIEERTGREIDYLAAKAGAIAAARKLNADTGMHFKVRNTRNGSSNFGLPRRPRGATKPDHSRTGSMRVHRLQSSRRSPNENRSHPLPARGPCRSVYVRLLPALHVLAAARRREADRWPLQRPARRFPRNTPNHRCRRRGTDCRAPAAPLVTKVLGRDCRCFVFGSE